MTTMRDVSVHEGMLPSPHREQVSTGPHSPARLRRAATASPVPKLSTEISSGRERLLRDTWEKHHRLVVYVCSVGLVLSMFMPWTRLNEQLSLTALATAQVFHQSMAWMLFLLLAASLITLLRPMHNMRLVAEVTTLGAFPLWVCMGSMMLFGIQHNSMTFGFFCAGLCSFALTAGGATDVMQRLQQDNATRLVPSYQSHCDGMPL